MSLAKCLEAGRLLLYREVRVMDIVPEMLVTYGKLMEGECEVSHYRQTPPPPDPP